MNKTNSIKPLLNANTKTHILFHFVLWALAFTVLIFVFTKGKIPVMVDYYYTLVFLLLLSIPILFNFYVLMKYFLNKERYGLYLTSLLITFIIYGTLLEFYFLPIIDLLFPNYFFISYLGENDFYLVFSILLVATTLIKLTEEWFYFNRNQNELLKLQKQQIQTQLTALRSQVNPHFLFNSLNVIYALSLDKKEKITDAVVELSDILRYVIYDSNTDRVALKDEIELLRNYIAFQKHRINNSPTQFVTDVEDENFKIYPMLLLPLVENAYKYGASAEKKIEIHLTEKDNVFNFSVYNSKVNMKNTLEDAYSGFGLKHLKKNLNIVYQGQHNLKIENSEHHFKVELSLYKS